MSSSAYHTLQERIIQDRVRPVLPHKIMMNQVRSPYAERIPFIFAKKKEKEGILHKNGVRSA